MNKSDHDLFCKLCAPTNALNHSLPPTRNRASLRTRGHSYQLPEYSTDLYKKSFLIRSLYSFVRWNSFFLVLLLCTVRHSDCFLCLFLVRLSHLINITYIHTVHTYIYTYIHTMCIRADDLVPSPLYSLLHALRLLLSVLGRERKSISIERRTDNAVQSAISECDNKTWRKAERLSLN